MAIQKMTAVFPLMSKKLETAMPAPKKSVTGTKPKTKAASTTTGAKRGRPAGSKTSKTKTKLHKTAVAKSRANPMTVSALSGFKSKGAHYGVQTKAKVGGRGRTKVGATSGTKSGSGKKRTPRAGVPSTAGAFLNADKTKMTRMSRAAAKKPAGGGGGGKTPAQKRAETCAKKAKEGNPCGRPKGTGTAAKKPAAKKPAAKNPKRTKLHKTAVAKSRANPMTVSALSGFKSRGATYDRTTKAKTGGRGRGKVGTVAKGRTTKKK